MLKNSTLRYLACILGAWILSWGLALSFPAIAALHTPVGMTTAAHHGANLAVNTPAHIQSGGGDAEFILEERENPDTDAPALTDLEQPQVIAAAGSPALQRAAVSVHIRAPHSALPAEPRFLRNRRLLN